MNERENGANLGDDLAMNFKGGFTIHSDLGGTKKNNKRMVKKKKKKKIGGGLAGKSSVAFDNTMEGFRQNKKDGFF